MFVALGLLTMLALLSYSGALGSIARSWFYPGMLVGAGALMLVLRLLIELDQRWVYAALWLAVNVLVLVTFTFMWNIAGDVSDARSAKRFYPFFAAAGVLGGFLGGLATGPLARTIGVENILIVLTAIFALAAVLTTGVVRTYVSVEPSGTNPLVEMKQGANHARRSPLLRLLGVAMMLAAVLFYWVLFPFSTAVAESFETEAAIASYLGLFSASATAVTFIVSLFVTNRIFARFGVLLAIFIVAVFYVTGFTLWLASFTLLTASVFRFVQWVGVNGIQSTARNAVFNVLRADKRGETMAFLSAVPLQLGLVLAGLLLWGTRDLLSPQQAFVLGLAFAVSYATVVWAMRSHYTGALVTALRSGLVDVFTGAQTGHQKLAADADAVTALTEGIHDERPGTRRVSAEMLGRVGGADAAQTLTTLIDDPDIEVRVAALDALSRLADEHAGLFTVDGSSTPVGASDVLEAMAVDGSDATLGQADPAVQARAAGLLYQAGDERRAAELMESLLRSPDAETRRVVLGVITEIGWSANPEELRTLATADPYPSVRADATRAIAAVEGADETVIAGMEDPSPIVRSAAGSAWRDQGGAADLPIELLKTGPPQAWEAAVIALEDSSQEVKKVVLAWAAPKVAELAKIAANRATLNALIDGRTMPATSYLAYLMSEREWAANRLAIRVLGLFETPQTVELIVKGIRSDDVDAHAQALEAVESIGGALGRVVVPILENDDVEAIDVRSALDDLSQDADPWVRALTVRAIRELVADRWKTVVELAASDDDAIVRQQATEAIAMMGPDMTETLDTLGTLDRVLYLRQVPIFSSLYPQDLEQLAAVMTEQLFEAGDVIFRAGDPGDEILIIVEGRILVSSPGNRADGDSREFGPGDYVGELALLRHAPRSADVAARDTVRVLALDSASLNNVLADRPDVTRAMLEVLAERLADPLRLD